MLLYRGGGGWQVGSLTRSLAGGVLVDGLGGSICGSRIRCKPDRRRAQPGCRLGRYGHARRLGLVRHVDQRTSHQPDVAPVYRRHPAGHHRQPQRSGHYVYHRRRLAGRQESHLLPGRDFRKRRTAHRPRKRHAAPDATHGARGGTHPDPHNKHGHGHPKAVRPHLHLWRRRKKNHGDRQQSDKAERAGRDNRTSRFHHRPERRGDRRHHFPRHGSAVQHAEPQRRATAG